MGGFHVLDAKRALVQAAQAVLPDAHVRVGLPPNERELPKARERVYFTETRNLTRVDSPGLGPRAEAFDVLAVVEVYNPSGDKREETEARLWAILSLVDDAIEADDELGGAATGSALQSVESQACLPTDTGGWVAYCTAHVRVEQMVR